MRPARMSYTSSRQCHCVCARLHGNKACLTCVPPPSDVAVPPLCKCVWTVRRYLCSLSSPYVTLNPRLQCTARPCAAGAMPGSNAFASLHLEGAPAVKAKLVVGSDGGNSKVRQLAQLRTVSWSYKQRGLVATVATATPNTAALQVFLPNGPLALLPVRDGFSNIVWSTTPAQAAELEAMTPDNFVTAVNMVSTAFLSSKSKPSPCLQSAFCMLPNLEN